MNRYTRWAAEAVCGGLAALALTGAVGAQAAGRPVPVQVDGYLLDTAGYLDQGVTYAPLRSVLDAFGGWELHWDSAAGAAVAQAGGRRLTADPAADTITVDGETFSGRVFVENGRTYVPLRLTAAACGGETEWDPYLGGAAVTSPGAEYDAADLYWLSRIISAESRGESMTGQVAVGNVVLNRVAAEQFPDTIPGVIFDTKFDIQFTPVENGTVYDEPAPASREAALRALAGEAPVGGALYFFAPALSQGVWIRDNRTYHTTIGCHRFYL